MKFHWKPNGRPGAEAAEGESRLLADFLSAEIGLSLPWIARIFEEMREDPQLEWVGNEMELQRDGDVVLLSRQFGPPDAEPDAVPLSQFVGALRAWHAFVSQGPSDKTVEYPPPGG